MGGAEFYPSCSQLRVGGDKTGAPHESDLVSLPGAYSDADPGIYTPNVYNPGFTYIFPGPSIASFISGNASIGGTTSNGSTSGVAAPSISISVSVPLPSASRTATASSSSKSCRVVQKPASQTNQALISARHVGRGAMKRLGFSSNHHH